MQIELLILSVAGALIAMGISFSLHNPLILRGLLASALALIAVVRVYQASVGEKLPPAVDSGMTYALYAIAITLVVNVVVNKLRGKSKDGETTTANADDSGAVSSTDNYTGH